MDSFAEESSPRKRTALAELRTGAGHTQESLAEALQISRSSVARWERGEGGLPHPALRQRLSDTLGLTVAELEKLFDPLSLKLLPAGGAKPHSTGLVLPAGGGQTGTGAFTGMVIGRARLDEVEQTIAGIVAAYEQTGPAEMSMRALDLRGRVTSWIEASPRLRDRVELYRYGAQLAGLLAYMAVNVGRFRLADAYCGEALHLADEAGDLDLQLWVRGTQAHCAYYEGNWDLAVAYAQAGRNLSPTNPQAIRLLVNGEARSQAKLGHRQLAERAVGEAMDLLEREDIDAGLTPCISFEPYGYARLAGNAATAHVAAGDIDRVLDLTRNLDGEVESLDSAWSRALIGLDVATTLLVAERPEVDEAMRLGQQAMNACSTRPIRSVWQRALELHQISERWADHPSVVDYHDEFRTWSSSDETLAVAGSAA